MNKISPCPFCGGICKVLIDPKAFMFQNYSDRYPKKVAEQNNGFQVRCLKCGCQTCWWHYEKEAIKAWNTRKENESGVEADAESRCPKCSEPEPVLCCENCGHRWSRTA